jgi:hypothetical protein
VLITTLHELRCDREIARIRLLVPARRGAIACVICGGTKGVSNHHETYFAPRDVIPLCAHHHLLRHSRLRARGRDPVRLYMDGRAAGRPCPLAPALSPSEAISVRWQRHAGARA